MADVLPISADVQTKRGYLMNGSLVVPIEVIIKAIEESSPGAFGDIPFVDIEITSVHPRTSTDTHMVDSIQIQFRKYQAK